MSIKASSAVLAKLREGMAEHGHLSQTAEHGELQCQSFAGAHLERLEFCQLAIPNTRFR